MSTKHPLPELKKWTQRNLKPEDYDFLPLQDSPRHVLAAVWHWEVDRELGSRKGPFMVNKASCSRRDLLRWSQLRFHHTGGAVV